MEVGKTQDLQGELASWRPRRADGLALVWVLRPENQESQRHSPIPKAGRFETQEEPVFQFELEGKRKPMSLLKTVKQKEFPPIQEDQSFVLFWTLINWTSPVYIREDNLLYSVYLLKWKS